MTSLKNWRRSTNTSALVPIVANGTAVVCNDHHTITPPGVDNHKPEVRALKNIPAHHDSSALNVSETSHHATESMQLPHTAATIPSIQHETNGQQVDFTSPPIERDSDTLLGHIRYDLRSGQALQPNEPLIDNGTNTNSPHIEPVFDAHQPASANVSHLHR